MADPFLTLKPTVRLLEEAGRPVGLEEPGNRRLRLPGDDPSRGDLLRALAGGGTLETLCGSGSRAALDRRYLLARIELEGWLRYALVRDGRARATLEPLTRDFRFPAVRTGPCRLSRFAWIRRLEDGDLTLEAPLAFARMRLAGAEALAWIGPLAHPQTPDTLADATTLARPEAETLLALLLASGAVAPCGEEGGLPEDRDPALRTWEFHDLLFHSRSRSGRHGNPTGGTFRFLESLDPPPAHRPPLPGPGTPLPEPVPPPKEPGFFRILEARKSLRAPRDPPITLAQLGSFLHYVARTRSAMPPDPASGRFYEALSGPCPGSGGLHELDLFLSVARCAGLAPGFYRYARDHHLLEPWPCAEAAWGNLLTQAREAMGARTGPDILVTLAARVQRVAWKYEAIAYALILKDAGVMLQQMYLVATALGLAPCALGTGDSQVFARASGLDFLRDAPVAEFALSG
jgi:SagB-type dehydrogenase family enzyme